MGLVTEGISKMLNDGGQINPEGISQKVRRIAGGFVNEETKRRPMIIPIVSLAK